MATAPWGADCRGYDQQKWYRFFQLKEKGIELFRQGLALAQGGAFSPLRRPFQAVRGQAQGFCAIILMP